MRFTNPFSHPPRDTHERHSLIAGVEYGRASPSTESLDDIIDMEKHEYPFLISVRSARNSVSSFLNEHLHLGGDLTWTDRLLTLLTTLKPFVFLFLPTFFVSPFNYFTTSSAQRPKSKKLGPTAYLDGLRGVAAFVVYIFHFSYLWYPDLRWGYGLGHDMFWQMPIIRSLHSGRASVTVFFVISGFVLTLKTLTIIHKGKMDQAFSALAGSAFRRPFRLYLPIFASTFIIALLVYGGEYIRDPSGASVPPRGPTLDQQLHHWFWSTVDLMNPFRVIVNRENMKGSEYDGHLWTIPVEFKGSLLVFFLLLIFARAKRWIHMVGVTGVAIWLVRIGDWDQALFCAGLLLAELSIILPNAAPKIAEIPEDELPSHKLRVVKRVGSKSFHIIRHVGTMALFFLGLHLFSYPEYYGASTPGFITISQWVPDYYKAMGDRTQLFWNSIGAIIFIFAMMYSPAVHVSFNLKAMILRGRNIRLPWHQTRSDLDDNEKEELATAAFSSTEAEAQTAEPLLQRPFTTSFAQYLGQISYSLYLWHGAINHMVGVRWLSPAHTALQLAGAQAKVLTEGGNAAAGAEMVNKAWSAYALAFFWGSLVNTLALFWASDVFNRIVDVNAMRLTRWLGEKAWRKD
ncbi:hypothetical protein SGCOL_008869 [Colletotrichum sp. CLE4]